MRIGLLVSLAAIVTVGCSNSAPPPAVATAQQTPANEQRTAGGRPRPESSPASVPTAAFPAKPASGELPDFVYVPDDAFAVAVFNARRAFESQALAALPYDEVLGSSIEAWSFDPREVEHWLLFLTPPVDGEPLGTPYSPGAVIRFVKPVDGRKLIATRGEFREAQLGGKPYYVQTVPNPTAFYVVDDRTIVFAAERQLARMLSAAETKNPLAGRLAGADRDCDFQVLVNIGPLMPALDAMQQAAGQQLPQAAAPYFSALRDVSMIATTIDLSGRQLLTATIETRGPEEAKRLHQLAKASGPLVQACYQTLRGAIMRAWTAEAAGAVLGVSDSAIARAVVSYEPASLRIEVPRPPQLDDFGRRMRVAQEPGSRRR